MRKILFVALVLVGCSAPKDTPNRGEQNNGVNYPAGPYGYSKKAIMANLSFSVKVDPLGYGGTTAYNTLATQPQSLADFYNDPDVSWIVLTGAAGWCGPCREEAGTVPAASQKWGPMGVRFLTVLIQGFDETNQTPSMDSDIDRWQVITKNHIAIGTDPQDELHEFAAEIASFPLNIIIKKDDMSIQYTELGIDPNNPSIDPILTSLTNQ